MSPVALRSCAKLLWLVTTVSFSFVLVPPRTIKIESWTLSIAISLRNAHFIKSNQKRKITFFISLLWAYFCLFGDFSKWSWHNTNKKAILYLNYKVPSENSGFVTHPQKKLEALAKCMAVRLKKAKRLKLLRIKFERVCKMWVKKGYFLLAFIASSQFGFLAWTNNSLKDVLAARKPVVVQLLRLTSLSVDKALATKKLH